MSVWQQLNVEQEILAVLASVPAPAPPSPLGRPFVTSYQLAIELERRAPHIRQTLNLPLGGAGSGRRASMAQYLGRELSQRIRRGAADPSIEGAFVSDSDVVNLSYREPGGTILTSSVSGTGFDLALFRIQAGSGDSV